MADQARAYRILTGIDPRTWEHPADRAALNALRKITGFEDVVRKVLGLLGGERGIRLLFLANAVKVTPTQHPKLHEMWQDVMRTLDSPEQHELYVTYNPVYNAAALGIDRPFVLIHSEMVRDFQDDELRFVMGHELGHVMSGHAMYTTLLVLLLRLVQSQVSFMTLPIIPIVLALLEWSRKAELSSDRAGLLAVQTPDPGLRTMLKFAGGTFKETNLGDFIQQAEEYRASGELADIVYKVMNVLWVTHPFPVVRVAEMRTWFESGAYERIMMGEYRRRGEPDAPYSEDLSEARKSYADAARETLDQAGTAARRVVDSFRSGFGRE